MISSLSSGGYNPELELFSDNSFSSFILLIIIPKSDKTHPIIPECSDTTFGSIFGQVLFKEFISDVFNCQNSFSLVCAIK